MNWKSVAAKAVLSLMIMVGLAALPMAKAQQAAAIPQAAALQSKPAAQQHWVATWSAAQFQPWGQLAIAPEDLKDATLRQIVHLTAGGTKLRVRLSNVDSNAPLHLKGVHVAQALAQGSSRIDISSDRPLTFSGSEDVTLTPGGEYLSDPVDFPVAALSELAISIYFEAAPAQESCHADALDNNYLMHGNQMTAIEMPQAKIVNHWYQISGVEVMAAADSAAVIALGDSITDGYGATPNMNARWPDELARRLQGDKSTQNLSVINEGIGGNHMLTDGIGPNTLSRFDRDVLAQAGARYMIVLEGVNDLGGLTIDKEVSAAEHDTLVKRIIASYEQVIERAHAHGIRVMGATITPYMGNGYYHAGPASEADRQKINAWIRTAGHFDAVVDFDKLVGDPQNPGHLLPAFDSGDHIHPSVAGYKTMGDAIPLTFFTGAE